MFPRFFFFRFFSCELCVPALFFFFVPSVLLPRGSNSSADAGPIPSTRRSPGSVTEGGRERGRERREDFLMCKIAAAQLAAASHVKLIGTFVM